MRRSKISPSQLSEWTESAVTTELHELISKQIEELNAAKANCFYPFQAERTQEAIAGLNGAVDTWELALEVLEGDWSYFVVEEEDE